MKPIVFKTIEDAYIVQTAKQHKVAMDDEFLTGFGSEFLNIYYKAWIDSPYSYNIVAMESEEDLNSDPSQIIVAGAMLVALDPSNHYRYIFRHHIWSLSFAATKASLSKPTFLLELLRTRGIYYLQGISKMALRSIKSSLKSIIMKISSNSKSDSPVDMADDPNKHEPLRIAELTHIFTDKEYRRLGIATTMIQMLKDQCESQNISRIELVTPAESDAVRFYEKLGFSNLGTLVAKTKENFIKFQLDI